MRRNTNYFIKAAVVLAIAFAMVLPASAVLTNTKTTISKDGTFSVPQQQQVPLPRVLGTFDDILTEGFEDPWVADSNGDLAPPGWEVHKLCTTGTDPFQGYFHRTGTIPFSDPGPVVPHGGSWQAFCHWSYDAQNEWLVTPVLTLSGASNLEFWFYGHYGSTNLDHYYVKLSPTGGYNQGDFTVTLWDASAQPAGENHYDTPVEIDLSAYSGQSIRLAWNFVDGDGAGLWYGTVLDDILVTSGGAEDTTPPVTTCALAGTMEGDVYVTDVTATLTATDDSSGVDYTMYKVDDGTYAEYTVPIVVTDDGEHTVYFYSVDIAGNIETEKTSEFTIQHPAAVEITIKGGLGVSADIKNVGTTDMTGVEWTINLDGGLILLGKTKTGTIDIPAGETVTVKDFVFGFGKTAITATAGTTEATATGTVLLFFVIGVA